MLNFNRLAQSKSALSQQRSSRLTFGSLLFIILAVIVIRNLFFPLFASPPPPTTHCTDANSIPDGGDCQALGEPRRPSWACPAAIRAAVAEFIELYHRRPVRDNSGGMRIDHAFALWYTLRAVKPKVVIESGAFKGQGTWIMRNALPSARIISVDPRAPTRRLRGVEYLVHDKFEDFSKIDWRARGVNPRDTVVFLDDHQSAFRRIFTDNEGHGFFRFIAEDNYPYLQGDNMSLKWVCELQRRSLWPNAVRDDFGRKRIPLTWEQHMQQARFLKKAVKIYYEFPPLFASSVTKQTRYDPRYASRPLFDNEEYFRKKFSRFDRKQFKMYTHFSYVEIHPESLHWPM